MVALAMSNDTQPPVNLFAAQQDLLRERLRLLFTTLYPLLRADVVRVLEEEGKLLAKSPADAIAVRPAGA